MEGRKRLKRSKLRVIFGVIAGLCAVMFAFIVADMQQAQAMAGELCKRAIAGMPVIDFLPLAPERDFRRIMGRDQYILVARKGMGRYNCTVDHDGSRITGAQVNFLD